MSFFGKNVKKIRGVKKMSQQAFADLFQLKRATLGAYEEGRSEPKIDTIIKVANYFSISIDDMLTKDITINQLLSFDVGVTTDLNHIVKNALIEVPFVNELNKKIFTDEFDGINGYLTLPKIQIPIKNRKNLLAFTVQDLIMVYKEEGLYPGDVVVGVQKELNNIESDVVVLVMQAHQMYIRRLKRNGQSVLLVADHVNISPIELDSFDGVFFWEIEHVILNRYPNFVSTLEERINSIDERLKRITDQ